MLKISNYTFHCNVHIEVDNSSVREEIGKVLGKQIWRDWAMAYTIYTGKVFYTLRQQQFPFIM